MFNIDWLKIFIFISYTSGIVSMSYVAGRSNERNSYENKQKLIVIKNLQDQMLYLQKSQAVNISIIDKLNKEETQSKSFYEGLKHENHKLFNERNTCYLSNKQLRLIQRARSGYATKMSDAESSSDITGISTTNTYSFVNYSIDQSGWAYMCKSRYEMFQKYYYGNGGK